MQGDNYRSLGGVLEHVLDTIRMVHEMGIWLEIVTLVIPDFNDSNDELWELSRFHCFRIVRHPMACDRLSSGL